METDAWRRCDTFDRSGRIDGCGRFGGGFEGFCWGGRAGEGLAYSSFGGSRGAGGGGANKRFAEVQMSDIISILS